jgi:uncharacterized membrane protein YphA (DoxX/SURF4 family)
MPSAYQLSCFTLVAIFLWSGWLLLFGPGFIAEEFRKWKYPDWLRVAVGVAEWSIAAMLIFGFAPRLAILLALAIMAAVIFTFVKDRQFMRLENPLLIVALLAIAYSSSPSLGMSGN